MEELLYSVRPIAHIYTDFHEKFGIPRQSGLSEKLEGRIVFEEAFRDRNSIRGIEAFSHLWLIWGFSETRIDMTADPVRWSALVTPPRLGGKVKTGVFATRSPYRPNSLGLSCVKLIRVERKGPESPVLIVGGADILNATPIYDIKPYLPYSDSHPEASEGFAISEKETLQLDFPDPLLKKIPEDKREALCEILVQDPRGAYEKQPGYPYGIRFADFDIRFIVENGRLRVFEVLRVDPADGQPKIK